MIHLVKSHNLNIQSEALAEKLTETAPRDPFVSQKIIVPNLDTARWFKLYVAEKNSIAANLECILPAEWFWSQIRKLYPNLPELLPSDIQPMKWTLFQLLSDDSVRKQFDIINRYVESQPEERSEQAAFQLAGQIASVFDEYLVYRPKMILQWQNGRLGKGDEKWQAELWRMLNKSWKKSDGNEHKNRAELFDEVLTSFSNQELEIDDSLFVLNPGLLPMPIIKMFKIIGKQSDLFIYQLEPSKKSRRNSNELIQVFGREAERIQDNIKILDPDKVCDLHFEISKNSTLNQIKSGILNGNSVSVISDIGDKIGGIEIRSCHSPLREIEVLHQFLLEKFEENETLQPDDILVAAPDLETYRPYIKAVFDHADKSLPKIPYHVGYSTRQSDDGIERALLRLLTVIDSRFEFADVIDLFMMKPVYQSFGISESDCYKLKRWIEENHVIWGLDSDHRKEFDQPQEELQTWNSAMRRGWLGNLLGGEKGEVANDLLLYQSIQTTNDQEVWAAFSSFLHQLNRMRNDIKQKQTSAVWGDWLTGWLESLFQDASHGSVEAQKINREIVQIQEQAEVGGCKREIPFSLFKSELTSMLDRHKASGALFTKGVTFSSMVPVRSIPFKIIALIGLNGSDFPRKQITPDFELMAKNPLPGERNRKNEDRNLFLESIIAAGDVHYCSYIGQSLVDNEEIPPSTIVSEWADLLSKVTGTDASDIIQKEALSGFSPTNYKSKKSYSKLYFQTAKKVVDDKSAGSGLKIDQAIPPDESEEPIEIDDLIRFYGNPIQWFLRKRFEVSFRELDREKEEFDLDGLEFHILFQRVFGWVMNGMPDQQIQKYLVESGSVPVGWAGQRMIMDIKTNVKRAISEIRNVGVSPEEVVREISVQLNNANVEGSLISYSSEQFMDVNPSGFSGKTAIRSWVQHLLAQAGNVFSKNESILFCDLKKGEPEKIIYNPVENPESVLQDLIDFYRQGMTEPQHFFPKTLYTFEERERGGKKDAYKRAASTFEGGWHRGEREDRFIQAMLGADVSFQNEFIRERYRKIVGQMLDHMKEGA